MSSLYDEADYRAKVFIQRLIQVGSAIKVDRASERTACKETESASAVSDTAATRPSGVHRRRAKSPKVATL